MVWKGVIIEESLDDKSLLDTVTEIGYLESLLEGEDEKGLMHFHQFEVQDDKKDIFVSMAKSVIRQGWYIHMCKDATMTMIFRDRVFEFTEADKDKVDEAKKYGISVGILPEQLEIEPLIRNPLD